MARDDGGVEAAVAELRLDLRAYRVGLGRVRRRARPLRRRLGRRRLGRRRRPHERVEPEGVGPAFIVLGVQRARHAGPARRSQFEQVRGPQRDERARGPPRGAAARQIEHLRQGLVHLEAPLFLARLCTSTSEAHPGPLVHRNEVVRREGRGAALRDLERDVVDDALLGMRLAQASRLVDDDHGQAERVLLPKIALEVLPQVERQAPVVVALDQAPLRVDEQGRRGVRVLRDRAKPHHDGHVPVAADLDALPRRLHQRADEVVGLDLLAGLADAVRDRRHEGAVEVRLAPQDLAQLARDGRSCLERIK